MRMSIILTNAILTYKVRKYQVLEEKEKIWMSGKVANVLIDSRTLKQAPSTEGRAEHENSFGEGGLIRTYPRPGLAEESDLVRP